MSAWLLSGENQTLFSQYCRRHTPITIIDADDPEDRLDCIPLWLTGDAYCVIVDMDHYRHGLKRGQRTMGDLEDIGDVIVREK